MSVLGDGKSCVYFLYVCLKIGISDTHSTSLTIKSLQM